MTEESTAPMCPTEHHHDAAIASVRSQMPSEGELFDLAEFFSVFGDPTRVKLLTALEHADLCVCDLAALFDMTKSAVSHQLRILRQTHLVAYRRQGKNIIYSLADDHVRDIMKYAIEHLEEPSGKKRR